MKTVHNVNYKIQKYIHFLDLAFFKWFAGNVTGLWLF